MSEIKCTASKGHRCNRSSNGVCGRRDCANYSAANRYALNEYCGVSEAVEIAKRTPAVDLAVYEQLIAKLPSDSEAQSAAVYKFASPE